MLDLSDVPAPARTLGFLGTVPFIAGAAGFWLLDGDWSWVVFELVVFYGCAILSFLGAVHWGAVIAEGFDAEGMWPRMIWGIMPVGLSTLIALMLAKVAIFSLIVGVAATFAMDMRAISFGWLPPWYGALRKVLSLIVILALAAILVRLFSVPNPEVW